MRKIIIVSFLSLIILTAFPVFGEDILSSLEEIAAFSVEHNSTYRSAKIDLLKAKDNKVGVLKVENSSLSSEGNYNNLITGNSFGLSSTLIVPIIDQISLRGTLEDDLSGQIGITLNPLSHSDSAVQSDINLFNAMISAESTLINIEISAVTAALNWMYTSRDIEVKKTAAELTEIKYKDNKIRYDLDELTLDNLQESLINWSEARKALLENQQVLRVAKNNLYTVLGSGPEDISVNIPDLNTLEKSLEILKENIDPDLGSPQKNNIYKTSFKNVESSKAALKSIWVFDPNLSAGTSLLFNPSGAMNFSVSVGLTLSSDSFNKTQKLIAEEELQLSIIEADQSRNNVELEFEQVLEALVSTELNSEISKLEYEQTKIIYAEAELLKTLGDYSEIELQESKLSLMEAENSLYRAIADEYIAWLELKKYM